MKINTRSGIEVVITGLTRKRVTILEASPENFLIFQGFRGIAPGRTFRFSLLVFSPISGPFRRLGTHNLTCSGIEVVITGLTRNQFERHLTWVRIPPAAPKKPVFMRFLPLGSWFSYWSAVSAPFNPFTIASAEDSLEL